MSWRARRARGRFLFRPLAVGPPPGGLLACRQLARFALGALHFEPCQQVAQILGFGRQPLGPLARRLFLGRRLLAERALALDQCLEAGPLLAQRVAGRGQRIFFLFDLCPQTAQIRKLVAQRADAFLDLRHGKAEQHRAARRIDRQSGRSEQGFRRTERDALQGAQRIGQLPVLGRQLGQRTGFLGLELGNRALDVREFAFQPLRLACHFDHLVAQRGDLGAQLRGLARQRVRTRTVGRDADLELLELFLLLRVLLGRLARHRKGENSERGEEPQAATEGRGAPHHATRPPSLARARSKQRWRRAAANARSFRPAAAGP